MKSFKVSSNNRSYKGGCINDFVDQGCYAIDIYNSQNRTRQRTSVQIGDTFYMVKGNDYWVGTVTSDWLQMPLHKGEYHPFGFFHSVNAKRKQPLDVDHDEWVCKVNWGVQTRFTPSIRDGLKKKLNSGFNAVTIKPVLL
jgi:hypothetical protein